MRASFFVVTRKYFVGKHVIALITSRRDHTSSTLSTWLAKPQRFRNIAVRMIISLLAEDWYYLPLKRLTLIARQALDLRFSEFLSYLLSLHVVLSFDRSVVGHLNCVDFKCTLDSVVESLAIGLHRVESTEKLCFFKIHGVTFHQTPSQTFTLYHCPVLMSLSYSHASWPGDCLCLGFCLSVGRPCICGINVVFMLFLCMYAYCYVDTLITCISF